MIADDSTTVFISYAHEDMYAAERFHRELTSAGLNVWFDKLSLLPGQDWKVSIKQAINKSRYFLAILSRNSVNKKGFVQNEVAEALEIIKEFPPSEIFIIPVRLDDCEPSHIKLKDFQWADMFPRWEDGFAKVLSAIRTSSKTTDSRNEMISDKNLSEYDLVGRSRDLKSEIKKSQNLESADKISEILSNTAQEPLVAHIETWADFGRNLTEYVSSHKEELIAKSYDTIIGISEGGSIIAFSLSCELKANLHEYSKPFKPCVIPISLGFTYEGDIDELKIKYLEEITNRLEKDLKDYSITYNKGNPINVLVIDDNLTGAICMKFFERKLREMGCVANLGTLAYVRHPAFLKMETISEYPKNATCFVMPWAKLHEKRDLGLENNKTSVTKIKICIKLNKNFDSFSSFVDRLRRMYEIDEDLIINGSSVFYLRYADFKKSKFIELNYMPNAFYPPKHCLRPHNTNNERKSDDFIDLCSFGIRERTIGTCLVCSLLNRNKYLIRKVSTLAYSDEIYIKFSSYDNYDNNINLQLGIKNWFARSIPEIKYRISNGAQST